MKTCVACGIVKPLALFHRRRDRADGRRDECKECMRRRSKAYWHNIGVDRRHYVTNKDELETYPA
jgi:hypothetical protein